MKTISTMTDGDFDSLLWEYEANGRKALAGFRLTEAEMDVVAHRLTAAMREYRYRFSVDDDADLRDPEYAEFIDEEVSELLRELLEAEK